MGVDDIQLICYRACARFLFYLNPLAGDQACQKIFKTFSENLLWFRVVPIRVTYSKTTTQRR